LIVDVFIDPEAIAFVVILDVSIVDTFIARVTRELTDKVDAVRLEKYPRGALISPVGLVSRIF
jgi:hypothetical protein